MERAGLTTAGELQEQAVGRVLRENYVTRDGLLPPSFNQSTQTWALRVESSPAGNYGYVLRSAMSTLATLYPGGSIPIYSTGESLTASQVSGGGNCPSYNIEDGTINAAFDAYLLAEHGAFIAELQAVTGIWNFEKFMNDKNIFDNFWQN